MNFKELVVKAKKLGAAKLEVSDGMNKKYVVTLKNGERVHFGDSRYEDYITHLDAFRRHLYRLRATKIVNRRGRPMINNIESPNYWSYRLLW